MLTNENFYQIKQFNTNAQCIDILKKIFHKTSFSLTFHEYMRHHHHLLNQYLTDKNYHSQSQKVIRGKINEYLILLYFQNKGIINLYPQAYLFFIPDIRFDLVLFTETKRIMAFNFKTCLRDRYKQAMVEGQQIKKIRHLF